MNRSISVPLAVAMLALATDSSAQDDARFWTWQRPLGAAAEHPGLVRLARAQTSDRTPAESADHLCDAILAAELGAGEIAVVMQDFGLGDGDPNDPVYPSSGPALFRHWCDALPHAVRQDSDLDCEQVTGSDAASSWWLTPWMTHGVIESRAYMQAFVERYQARQAADPSLPDPTRFHFDTERTVMPEGDYHSPAVFDAVRDDPRWSSELLLGHGRTLAQLYADGGSPSYNPAKSWAHGDNHAWSVWYAEVVAVVLEEAMDAAAYQVVRTAWPGCKSSNFLTSARADGAGAPQRLVRRRAVDWYRYPVRTRAELQAPMLYFAYPSDFLEGETMDDATLRLAAEIVRPHVESLGGPHGDVVPWIQPVGSRDRAAGTVYEVSPELFRGMLEMLAAHGVNEFILWSNGSTQDDPSDWETTAAIIDDVFSFELGDIKTIESGPSNNLKAIRGTGNGPGGDRPRLRTSSGSGGKRVQCRFAAERAVFSRGEKIEITWIDVIDGGRGTVDVLAQHRNGRWISVGSEAVRSEGGGTLRQIRLDPAAFVKEQQVSVELRYRSVPAKQVEMRWIRACAVVDPLD